MPGTTETSGWTIQAIIIAVFAILSGGAIAVLIVSTKQKLLEIDGYGPARPLAQSQPQPEPGQLLPDQPLPTSASPVQPDQPLPQTPGSYGI